VTTRRAFSLGLAGAAAAAAFRVHADDKVKPSVVGGITLGVGSYSYRKFDIDRMIASMKTIGLSSVELWNGHLEPAKTSDDDYRAVKSRFDAAGITVSAYCVNFRTDWSDELLDKGFRGATLLGTNLMTASVEKPILDRLDAQCKKHKITVGLHNHYLGDPWFKGDKKVNFEGPADWAEAFKGRSDYLAINLDIGHFFAAGHDPVAYFKEHQARIVSLHIKDRDNDAAKTNRGPGEGKTPIVEVLKLAKQVRFKYAANLEWELDDPDPSDGVRRYFEYMKKALA
jgi:sugar phosphate isomerase/epimerase